MDLDATLLQQQEVLNAESANSDLDLAFKLQLEEAIAASLRNSAPAAVPSTSHSSSPARSAENEPKQQLLEDDLALFFHMQSLELQSFAREAADRQLVEKELEQLKRDVALRSHDAAFARDIEAMPDDDWEDYGDDFEAPFDEGGAEPCSFKLYHKGLVVDEDSAAGPVRIAAAGIVIYGADDTLLLQLAKPLPQGLSRAAAEYEALREGLFAARGVGIRNLEAHGDFVQVYKQVIGNWRIRQHKIMKFYCDVREEINKFDDLYMHLIPRCENHLALSLARQSIESQLSSKAELVSERPLSQKENCVICLEEVENHKMFQIVQCSHRYCFSCMAQHVEVQLRNGILPKCPADGCRVKLNVASCRDFLPSKWLEILSKRIDEASVPESDKVYCPYSDCSALMSKQELQNREIISSSSVNFQTALKCANCTKCQRQFCIECRVPWHTKQSCQRYQQQLQRSRGVDAKLHILANNREWKRCDKCKHMIELAEGCNHITCRCGHEFCYVCGAAWKDKKATCRCELWDERYIIRGPPLDEFDDSDEESDLEEEFDPYDVLFL